MYYLDNKNIGKIKNIIFIAALSICFLMLIRGCSSNQNFSKERKDLNKNINMLEKRYDSLEKISNNLKIDYDRYYINYVKDSITIDSLTDEIETQQNIAIKMENKADFYLSKYKEMGKKITILENNKNYKTGDSLLRSLSKKIN